MCVVESAQGRAHELSGRTGRGARRVVLSARRAADRLAQGAVLARAVDRARRLHGGSAEEVLPARAGPRGASALRLLHHVHGRREGRARARSSSFAARTIRRRAAATRPTAARCRAPSTGCRRRTRSTASCGCTTSCSRVPDPDGGARTAGLHRRRESGLAGRRAGREDRAERGERSAPGRAISSSGRAISSAMSSIRKPGALVFNRTVTLRDSLGEDEGQVAGPSAGVRLATRSWRQAHALNAR